MSGGAMEKETIYAEGNNQDRWSTPWDPTVRSTPILTNTRTVADRFEQFAIETKFGGRPNIGTISTAVVPTEEGR
jgi:hypothetical protein